MEHAAAEALSSLSRCYEKPVRWRIPCSPRPRSPVRGLRLLRPLRLRFRESGAFCASRSLLRDVPRGPIGTKTGPDVLCREDARGPFSAPPTNQRGPRGTRFVSEVFVTDHGSQVAGRRSPVAGRSAYAEFAEGRGRQDRRMNRPRGHRAPRCSSSQRPLRLCGVILQWCSK